MQGHIEHFSKGPEEMGNELWSSVGGYMQGNSMLGKDVMVTSIDLARLFIHVIGWNKYSLLGETVNDNKDGSKSVGGRELFKIWATLQMGPGRQNGQSVRSRERIGGSV